MTWRRPFLMGPSVFRPHLVVYRAACISLPQMRHRTLNSSGATSRVLINTLYFIVNPFHVKWGGPKTAQNSLNEIALNYQDAVNNVVPKDCRRVGIDLPFFGYQFRIPDPNIGTPGHTFLFPRFLNPLKLRNHFFHGPCKLLSKNCYYATLTPIS